MISNTKDLQTLIGEIVEKKSYIKHSSAWYLSKPEVTLIIDLQKSDYGGQYFVNLAIAIKALLSHDYPREEQCPLRMRLDDIVSDGKSVLLAFDLENISLSPETRKQILTSSIEEGMLWLSSLSSLSAIAEELRRNESVRNRSTLQVQKFLGIAHKN